MRRTTDHGPRTRRLGTGPTFLWRILQRLTKASAKQGLDYAWPRQSWLAREMGCCERTVNRWAAVLVAAGLVEVVRGRDGNRYHVLTHVSDPELTLMSGPEQTMPSDPEPTHVSGPEKPAPLVAMEREEPTTTEAAEGIFAPTGQSQPTRETSLIVRAEEELVQAGVSAPVARRCARRDPCLALVALAHYRAGRAAGSKAGPGLLVAFCREPGRFMFERLSCDPRHAADGLVDPFSVWLPPAGSGAMADRERQNKRTREASESARRRAEGEAYRQERAADQAVWDRLDAAERDGIEAAVLMDRPELQRWPNLFRDHCLGLARRLEQAAADLAAWEQVPEAERHEAERRARERWPLFCGGGKRWLGACWLELERLRKGR